MTHNPVMIVTIPENCHFTIHNIPFGVFSLKVFFIVPRVSDLLCRMNLKKELEQQLVNMRLICFISWITI